MTEASETSFDELQEELLTHGVDAALASLAERLRVASEYHDLFDVRLMQARRRLGLSVIQGQNLDDLEEPLRTRMEEAYLEACREVGHLLMAQGRVREAWMYLRPVGEKTETAAALRKIVPDESNTDQIIEVALHEGVAPALGFELVLANYGTCNAISMFDAQMHGRPRGQRQEVAGLLVRHLHSELLRSLRADSQRKQGKEPTETTIRELIADRDWLFQNDNYHIDTSHLSAVVRFALQIDEPADLRLALDLTEYGRRLSSQYQYAGNEPFVDSYPSHALFFQALLGENVAAALDYFRGRAENFIGDDSMTTPAEVYVALLSRLGRHAEALDACASLLSPQARTSGFAPSLIELARQSGNYQRMMEICKSRADLIGFAAGLVEHQLHSA